MKRQTECERQEAIIVQRKEQHLRVLAGALGISVSALLMLGVQDEERRRVRAALRELRREVLESMQKVA